VGRQGRLAAVQGQLKQILKKLRRETQWGEKNLALPAGKQDLLAEKNEESRDWRRSLKG